MLEHDIKNSYTVKFFSALQDLFLKKSIGVQTILLLIGFFLAGIGFVGVVLYPLVTSYLYSARPNLCFANPVYFGKPVGIFKSNYRIYRSNGTRQTS